MTQQTTNLSVDQMTNALRDIGFFVGGLSDDGIVHYYHKMVEQGKLAQYNSIKNYNEMKSKRKTILDMISFQGSMVINQNTEQAVAIIKGKHPDNECRRKKINRLEKIKLEEPSDALDILKCLREEFEGDEDITNLIDSIMVQIEIEIEHH